MGIVALPLAMAFAIASGVPPERGIFTAIVAGFLISLLGGSRVQIGGPTGAFVVIVYGIVMREGYGGLFRSKSVGCSVEYDASMPCPLTRPHFLNFRPLPQGHNSFRPVFSVIEPKVLQRAP